METKASWDKCLSANTKAGCRCESLMERMGMRREAGRCWRVAVAALDLIVMMTAGGYVGMGDAGK